MTGTKGAHVLTWDKEIGVIELFFRDLPEAKAFYRDVLGLEVDKEDDTSVSFVIGEQVVILLGPEGADELISPARVADPAAGASMCFTIAVPDVDAACADLQGHGVKIIAGPSVRRWGPRTAYFADPGGHIFEIVRSRDHAE